LATGLSFAFKISDLQNKRIEHKKYTTNQSRQRNKMQLSTITIAGAMFLSTLAASDPITHTHTRPMQGNVPAPSTLAARRIDIPGIYKSGTQGAKHIVDEGTPHVRRLRRENATDNFMDRLKANAIKKQQEKQEQEQEQEQEQNPQHNYGVGK